MPTTKVTTMIPSDKAAAIQEMYPHLSIHLAVKQYILDMVEPIDLSEKSFAIEVIKSTGEMWYKPFIGSGFRVVDSEENSNHYRLTKTSCNTARKMLSRILDEGEMFSGLYIKKEDCRIIIKESNNGTSN